jgi:hypothetical protein
MANGVARAKLPVPAEGLRELVPVAILLAAQAAATTPQPTDSSLPSHAT